MGKKDPMPRLCLRCDEDTAVLLERIAVSEGTTRSEVIRRLVREGIEAQEAPRNESTLQAHVQAAVREVVKPYVERLAAISAKSAQISAATFFMDAYIADSMAGPYTAQAMAIKAHQVGSEYNSIMKGREMEEVIKDLLKGKH